MTKFVTWTKKRKKHIQNNKAPVNIDEFERKQQKQTSHACFVWKVIVVHMHLYPLTKGVANIICISIYVLSRFPFGKGTWTLLCLFLGCLCFQMKLFVSNFTMFQRQSKNKLSEFPFCQRKLYQQYFLNCSSNKTCMKAWGVGMPQCFFMCCWLWVLSGWSHASNWTLKQIQGVWMVARQVFFVRVYLACLCCCCTFSQT